MTRADLVTELKVYLKIAETDITNDALITQAVDAAQGFIAASYSYYILDATIVKEFFSEASNTKVYLDAGPVLTVTTEIDGVPEVGNDPKIINNVAYYTTAVGSTAGELVSLTTTVGIDPVTPAHVGDMVQAVNMAAYFYKQFDKGLIGVEQYGTGIKESARLYDGIPRAILAYFEVKKIYRF